MASDPLEQSKPPTPADWLRTNRHRLMKFAGVGFCGVFVNLAVFSFTYHLVLGTMVDGQFRFVTANATGFVVSVFTNFLLNDWWTWGDRRKGNIRDWFGRLGKFYATASGAGAVQLLTASFSLAVLWVPLDPTPFSYKIAPILGVLTGIGCGMVINFTASHLWAFRDASPSQEH